MKRKIFMLLLSMIMIVAAFPLSVFAAEEEGVNVALTAKTSANYENEPVSNINDGVLAVNHNSSWNTWNTDEEYPVSAVLTWDEPQSLKSARIMWWADNANLKADNNVTFPKSAILEYYDYASDKWVQIKGMTNEFDETTDNIGVLWGDDGMPQPVSDFASVYTNGGNRYWNVVVFPKEVKTTMLRVTVDRNGSGSNGIGIGEFEVYDTDMSDIWGKVIGVNIAGKAITTKNQTLFYTGQSHPADIEGASYAWSVAEGSEDIIQIVGTANQETVQIKTIAAGKATLNLSITMGDMVGRGTKEIQIDGITDIDVYETNTAAGIAPILPKKVVANGIRFDDPTPSAMGNNGVNFGETFNSRLIDVVWDDVDPSLYAADKVGTTFEVAGTVTFHDETFDAIAKVSVKERMAAPVTNSTVTFENVQLTDGFWLPKQKVNAVNSLNKAILEIEKAAGGEPNFVNAIAKINGEPYSAHQGTIFQDTDIYKSIEAISYTLSVVHDSTDPDMIAQKEKLEAKLAYWISLIEQVQYADGYLGTQFTLRATSHRWRYFHGHEMYNAGHFYEAAVAYTRYREGIGEPDYSLYVVAKRSADQIAALFGPGGTRNEIPGHAEIELALVKLARLVEEYEGTGSGQKYLDTVKLLIDRRGESGRDSGFQPGEYSQDNGSIKEVTEAVGHAVRACYLYAGVTDIAILLPEDDIDRAAYLKSMDAIWESITYTKSYITGGIGTTGGNSASEGFGDAYYLPNDKSYCEVCAAIALANWNQRMNLVHEDAKYADVVERTLYNAILVGTNLEGNRFFYSSKLEVSGGNARSEWFACACCPPNLMRTIAKISEYMYTVHAEDLFINMYIGSTGNVNIDGTKVGLVQTTEYPWDGAVKLEVNPEADKAFTMNIRIPGWVADQYNKNVTITVNGEKVTAATEKGYVAVTRTWKAGDVVLIDIPMEIRMTEPDPNITTNEGKIALERGPIVYCMEKAGNAQINGDSNFNPLNFVIPRNVKLTAAYNPDLLNGVVEITGHVLYNNNDALELAKLQAVPYYAWNNRGDNGVQGQNSSSKMLIWTNAIDSSKADVSKLEAALHAEYEKKLVETDWSTESWRAYSEALAVAEETVKDKDAIQLFVDACLENLLAAIDGLQERTKETEANIAPFATASADYTNQYNTPETNINNKEFATGDPSTSWNCWGGATFPVGVYLTWDQEYTIDSMRVMWWTYNDGGVQFPGSCQVQYKNEDGNWVTITGMTNELDEKTDHVGVKYNGKNNGVDGANTYWNEVIFAKPVTTTALKLVVERQAEHTGKVGIGISEWQVFRVYTDEPTPTPAPTPTPMPTPTPKPVDKSALEDIIKQVPENSDAYTEDTWAVLEEALATANAVLEKKDVAQSEVDEAAKALEEALKALTIKEDGLPYVDVAEIDWFYEAVAYTYHQSFMTGMDETHFGPYNQLSRAQFALILYRIEGEPAVETEKSFADISGDEWYGPAVLWAAEAGIVSGYENGCFGPVDNITREQMAVMMHRYAEYLEKDVANEGNFSAFSDAESISEFAEEGMKWAVEKQIITGKEDGTMIDPQGETARAEAAAIITRYMEAHAE